MTKHELANRVVDITHVTNTDLGITRDVANACINATIAAIANAVARGDEVTLREFGTFQPKVRAAKTARNISAGTTMLIPEHIVPLFKPSDAFKKMVRAAKPLDK